MAKKKPEPTNNGHANGTLTANQYERLESLRSLVENAYSLRSQALSRAMGLDPRRDVEDECGYPQLTETVSLDYYQQLYDREAIATRVVEVLPKECWQTQPMVYEDESDDVTTPFEEAWDELGKQLRGQFSYYQDAVGSPIWEYLKRADILCGIGHFGLILLGIDDGRSLSEPIEGFVEENSMSSTKNSGEVTANASFERYKLTVNKKERKLLYLRVFPESLVQVTQKESNPSSPRHGQPTMYMVTLDDPRNQTSGVGVNLGTVNVHWTRVIHVADCLESSEYFGVPRMRPVLNNLLGLHKMYAGSPEMYWRGAFFGLSIETHPQLGADAELPVTELRDTLENYMNGLQRYLAIAGAGVKTLAPTVVDPTPQITVQIEAICIKLGIPIRVFKGSERGELASSQDDSAWNDRLKERQNGHLTPRLIIPFVDRLIAIGVLPEPKGYSVEWPDLTSMSANEKADIAVKKTGAIVQYVSSGGDHLISPLTFLTRVLDMDQEEAIAALEDAAKELEEKMENMPQLPPEQEQQGNPFAQEEESQTPVEEEEKPTEPTDEELYANIRNAVEGSKAIP